MKQTFIPYLGLSSGLGGRHPGSGLGPIEIQRTLTTKLWRAMVLPDPRIKDRLDCIAQANQTLANSTFETAQKFPRQIVVGGDHSCAIGTWSGISEARRMRGEELGLLWFDAHMDAHTFETSESGNPHGMPLASLLGYGSPKFSEILSDYPKLRPENLFLIGIRSFESGEQVLLEKLNVRIYYIEEVKQRGIQDIVREIIANLQARALPYGISLDVDFFDPSEICASGSLEPNGVLVEEFMEALPLFESYPPIGFELVEYCPPLDQEGKSLSKIQEILAGVESLLSCDPRGGGGIKELLALESLPV